MENGFSYVDNTLYAEGVALADIAARTGTPCYVYSAGSILSKYRAYHEALADVPHRICYAVKANFNLGVLRLLAGAGAGFDIVSGGELYRVLKAGGDPSKIVFSGVGKTAAEIEFALDQRIFSFNCESEAELALIDALAARRAIKARVAIRVNPDVDAATHPYISTGLRNHKFGVDIAEVERVYERARRLPALALEGVSCHIGSQLLDTDPIIEAVDIMLALAGRLRARGIPIRHVDFGGGLGIRYKPEDEAPEVKRFAAALREKVLDKDLEVTVEPGRSIVGEAGVLVTRVLYRKRTGRKEFIVVDASMSDLIRPALYQSHHEIIPLRRSPALGTVVADVVGPVCESGDFLARDRELANVLPGDLLAVCSAGAYGFALASNYNSRPRPAEVLVEGTAWRVVRARESYADLVRGE
ncbi:MAG: diaminopimelate decarboxylase [Bryobacteraceae bacterium]|nr:diaminopimelate decarboxylase [Bryobacteraceae bacterium]